MSALNRLADSVAERIVDLTDLDRLATPLASAVSELFGRSGLKDVFSGSWFGHPLHPLLTDLPIGSWTSAMVLDFVGGRRAQPAADALVAVGIATAVPTAVTGLSDWSDLGDVDRRIGLVHATANSIAVACYVASLVARRRGRRPAGVILGVAGATAATAGGFLGGHLVYRQALGANHVEDVPELLPDGWHAVADLDDLPDGLTRRVVETVPVLVYRDGTEIRALADRCSHLSGPLHEGRLVHERDGACVVCPWHGSEFSLADGSVVHGPATSPQPSFRTRITDGRVEIALSE